MVLPGFIEAHVHPSDECLKLIKNYTLNNPNVSVIRGFGWKYAAFGPNGPTKELLDSILKGGWSIVQSEVCLVEYGVDG